MAKARGLGRGLDRLMADAAAPVAERDAPIREGGDGVMELRVDRIVPNRWQPRQRFDQQKLEELARTIESHGLMQPLVVRRRGDDGSYELIAGERRLRAMRDILKKETVPVRLIQADDDMVREMALVENLQRDDLNPLEEAAAYQELNQELGMTHEAIAGRLQVSRSKITNSIRLLELPEEVKQLVAGGQLAAGTARALLGLDNHLTQIKLAKRAVAEHLNTRRVEQLVAEALKPRPQQTMGRPAQPHVADLEDRLRRHFSSKVVVEDNKGKGRIVIEYYSVDDAQRILERMGLPQD